MKCSLLLTGLLFSFSLALAQPITIQSLTRRPTIPDLMMPLQDLRTKELIQKAIARIPENYPDSPHSMEGFYRKVSTYENEYTHLLEAAFLMEDSSYTTSSHSALKVKLLQQRQSIEWGRVDNNVVTAVRNSSQRLAKLARDQVASSNTIHRTYEHNSIRHFNQPHTVFNASGRFTEGIDFWIRDTLIVDNDTVFHILVSDGLMPEGTSYLKINSRDLAIVEYQRAIYFHNVLTEQAQVRFKKIEGKYYQEFIQVKVPRIINHDIGGHQLDIHTLWVNKVETGTFKKIRNKEKVDRMQELLHLSFPYDESFWTNYSMLQNYPLEPAIQASLEKSMGLESQFKRQASQ